MPNIANYVYHYGSAKYGKARYARYSATYGNARYGYSRYGLAFNDEFLKALRLMEKKNIGDFFFEAGVVEPGFDNTNGPLDRVLRNLEK